MTPFEPFYCELWKLPAEEYELQKVKTEIKKEAYSLSDNYNFWNEVIISKEELLALVYPIRKILFYKGRIRVNQLFQLIR